MPLLAKISLIAGILLPFWNIPLIIRVIKRKSSADISLLWGCGIWCCLLAMLPYGLITDEIVLKGFAVTNFILFTITFTIILIYHKNKPRKIHYRSSRGRPL